MQPPPQLLGLRARETPADPLLSPYPYCKNTGKYRNFGARPQPTPHTPNQSQTNKTQKRTFVIPCMLQEVQLQAATANADGPQVPSEM